MGEFESLDQALLFQVGEGALVHELHGLGQLTQGSFEIVESLFPTNVL